MGMILPQPVAELTWTDNTFHFNTFIRVAGPGSAFYSVTGAIDGNRVHGTLQRLGGRDTRPQPSFEFSGAHP
jgi:hypothetical protein